MQLYREYAIITLDDDIAYEKDTFESFFNTYIEHPNIISGRRSHKMTFRNNGELNNYFHWKHQQKVKKDPDFDIFLTGRGGILYPPDILNINNDIIPIIKETFTNDDFTLKYISTRKGIPIKWIENNKIDGIPVTFPKSNSPSLFSVNIINNDIYIDKLNILIEKTILVNICTPYRNLLTGNVIYLFDIHNKHIVDNKLLFDLYAYSYCPIDQKLEFVINFDNILAKCIANNSLILNSENNNKAINRKLINCYINESDINLNNYYFPQVISKKNIHINIYHFKQYQMIIFRSFICHSINNCFLNVIILDKINKDKKYEIMINNKNFICQIIDNFFNEDYIYPIIKTFKCSPIDSSFNYSKIYISGIPNIISNESIQNNIIPNIFIINRIIVDINEYNKKLIIIGKLVDDLENFTYNMIITFIYPNISLECIIKPYSKYVQSKIYCNINHIEISSHILLENQITYLINNTNELLLINEETFIKIKFDHNNNDIIRYYKKNRNLKRNNNLEKYIIFLFLYLIIILLKIINRLKFI